MTAPAPPVLWQPSPERIERAAVTRFAAAAGMPGAPYDALWRWSVEDVERFWRSVWEHFDVQADGAGTPVLASRAMPGARWFPEARLNYAEHVFRGRADADLALQHASELRPLGAWTLG